MWPSACRAPPRWGELLRTFGLGRLLASSPEPLLPCSLAESSPGLGGTDRPRCISCRDGEVVRCRGPALRSRCPRNRLILVLSSMRCCLAASISSAEGGRGSGGRRKLPASPDWAPPPLLLLLRRSRGCSPQTESPVVRAVPRSIPTGCFGRPGADHAT